MTNREKQILQLLRNNVLIQQQEIAEVLGISRSAVAGHIMNLISKGYIKGRGYILSDHHTLTGETIGKEPAGYVYSHSLSVCLIQGS